MQCSKGKKRVHSQQAIPFNRILIVIVNARGGVHYHQGRTYVREPAALAVTAAIVCRRALPATTRSALVMPIKPPMAAYINVLKL
ncbi:hypothetical protein AHAS_Ahas06G0127400 [Arachis hypogaea]